MKTLLITAIATVFALNLSAQSATGTAAPVNKKQATAKQMDKPRPAKVITSDTPAQKPATATSGSAVTPAKDNGRIATGATTGGNQKSATDQKVPQTGAAPASTAPVQGTVKPKISKEATATSPKE